MNRTSLFFAAFLCLGGAACANCAGTTDAVTPGGKAISALDIEPSKETLSVGQTLKLRAVARFADGTKQDVTTDSGTVWNTSAPSVATVTKDGTVAALKPGLVDISALYSGAKGNEHFVVLP